MFTGGMFCGCPVGEDFCDFIFCKALHTTLPEEFANFVCGIPL